MSHGEWVSLALRERGAGRWVVLKCRRDLAAFCGWFASYQEHHIASSTLVGERRFRVYPSRRHRPDRGGSHFRMCFVDSRKGWPAGQTASFRITSNGTDADVARLAAATWPRFGWLTSFGGRRLTRDEWLERAGVLPFGAP